MFHRAGVIRFCFTAKVSAYGILDMVKAEHGFIQQMRPDSKQLMRRQVYQALLAFFRQRFAQGRYLLFKVGFHAYQFAGEAHQEGLAGVLFLTFIR